MTQKDMPPAGDATPPRRTGLVRGRTRRHAPAAAPAAPGAPAPAAPPTAASIAASLYARSEGSTIPAPSEALEPDAFARAALPDDAPVLRPLAVSEDILVDADAMDRPLTFVELGLAEPILQAVTDAGYLLPTPIQARAIPIALRGRDVMGLAQTGTGKTAAFTLPIVHRLLGGPRRTRVLILTPTRELCIQVEESFAKYSVHAPVDVAPVFGGMPMDPQTEALGRGVDVVVATPGRLLDHLERQHVVFDDLEVLVLDEADRMLDMGFAPQINKIVAQLPTYRQTLLFSATMPPEVEALARRYLRKPVVVQVARRNSTATTVTHAVYPVPKQRKSELLIKLLGQHPMDTVLVFVRTKHGADRVVRHLEKADIAAAAMHADKSQGQRIAALEDFRAGRVKVLVATDIAQRGLDISGITHVINYDVPQQAEDYVHRIGRTGRAAQTGDAFTFMDADEIGTVRLIEHVIGQKIPRVSVPGFDFGTVAAGDADAGEPDAQVSMALDAPTDAPDAIATGDTMAAR